MSKIVVDEFEDAEIVDVEPDPTLLWSGETVLTHKKKKATVVSGGVNLLNTIIGAGILSIPYAMARQGVVFGVFLVLLVAFLSHVSMTMLGRVGERILHDYQAAASVSLSEGPGSPTGEPDIPVSPSSGSLVGSDEDGSEGVMSPPVSPSTTVAAAGTGMPSSSSRMDLLDASQKVSDTEPRVTFPWVAKRVQPCTAIMLDVGMILFCLGACIAYLILIGDALPQVIGFIVDERPSTSVASLSESVVSSSVAEAPVRLAALRRRELWISIAIVVVAPFTFAKRLDVLLVGVGHTLQEGVVDALTQLPPLPPVEPDAAAADPDADAARAVSLAVNASYVRSFQTTLRALQFASPPPFFFLHTVSRLPLLCAATRNQNVL